MSELKTDSELVPTARRDGRAVVAAVRGEIDLHNSPDFRASLLQLVASQRPDRLVLNLDKVPYMDSSAIAVLVELVKKLRENSGKICLTNLQPRVKSLLQIARLDTIFVLAATEEEAMKK